MRATAACLLLLLLLRGTTAAAEAPFIIKVVDQATGRGVPLVELRTVNDVSWYSDSNGIVAFHEPGVMGQRVFFHVSSHGYEYPKDGFGFRGKALDLQPGGSAELKIQRRNIAERLYRVTGGGIYRESLLAGRPVPLQQPVLNGQVFGQDSVVNAVFRKRLYWFWGDTNRPAYPLGNYNVPGATSRLPADGGLDPETGVDLTYFVDEKGFAKSTCRMPGEGPTWIGGLVVLKDGDRERLFAGYLKVRGNFDIYQRGLVEFDPEQNEFKHSLTFPLDAPAHPDGHPFHHQVNGVDYVYFATPFPRTRVKADPASLQNLAEYETFTCLKAGTPRDQEEVERDAAGRPVYAWKKNTPPPAPKIVARLTKSGKLKADEVQPRLRDFETGKPVQAHGGSVYWNRYRQRWVMITVEVGGTSHLGEVWFAEADTPTGPWNFARKIVTHEKYSFYNPKQHPFFDKEDGRVIFFEGTYTHTFSGNTFQTPRYDYNQMMYKLDLAEPRLALPVAVYALPESGIPDRFGMAPKRPAGEQVTPAFFALERAIPGSIALPHLGIHALPADTKNPPPHAVPLHEFLHEDGQRRAWSVDPSWTAPGFKRQAQPVCLVWK